MKKTLFAALALVLLTAFTLTGCASDSGTPDDTDAQGFVFVSNGVDIPMMAKADDVLADLGEENSYFEAESCAYQGMDKIYTYSGFELRTNELDGVDTVTSVMLIDDSVSTPEGVSLYMTKEDMISAYGEAFTEEMGLCTYIKGDTELSFLIEDNEIISIEYTAAAESN